MSLGSTTAPGKFALKLLAAFQSTSTAAAMSIPMSANPREKPPAPANTSTTLYFPPIVVSSL